MATISLKFHSGALSRFTEVQVLLPNDVPPMMTEGNPNYQRQTKVLYLLHGFTGCSTDWLHGSQVQDWALMYNLAVIMPDGGNSFYLNRKGTGRAFQTYVGEELPAYIEKTFGLNMSRENTYIGGLSMGGFGALHTGLAYPDKYAGIFALSSALIIHAIKGMKEGTADEAADYDYYYSVFGDLETVDESDNNPEVLLKKAVDAGKEIPRIYMACGTEDFLLENNREFDRFARSLNLKEYSYNEGPGMHDFGFWNKWALSAIEWLLS